MFEKARPINAVSGAYDPGAQTLAVDAKNVVMRFGAAVALRGIDFQSETGKIHALVGANGAGKSTFLGIIAGRLRPTLGDVAIFGRPYDFGSPRHARQLGIAAIYQELTIVSAMSTQANVFLGQSIARAGLLAQRQMRDEFLFLCKRFGVSIPPDIAAGRLAIADQQMLEIMRGVRSGARLLLFDEPTASLAPPECEALFRTMRELRGEGVTMLFVSHKLQEVLEIADVVTVFRDGRVAVHGPRPQWNKNELVRAMIGRDLRTEAPRRKATFSAATDQPILSVRSLSIPGVLHGIHLDIRRGEIVGLGGLVGSGRTSLLRSLAGLEPHSRGELLIEGKKVGWPQTPAHALAAGISLVPEDRKTQGLVLSMTAASNIIMTDFSLVSKLGVLSAKAVARRTREVAQRFGFDETRLSSLVRNLSGGNQQKVLLSKWGYRQPKVLLVDEPTRGIDIGAKQEILSTLRQMADGGLGILIVSSELEEVVTACNRVLVLAEGRIVAGLDQSISPVRVEDILRAVFNVVPQ
jgi:ABC-type sugar transport system ATPase subunit